jgi:hypothetical protein
LQLLKNRKGNVEEDSTAQRAMSCTLEATIPDVNIRAQKRCWPDREYIEKPVHDSLQQFKNSLRNFSADRRASSAQSRFLQRSAIPCVELLEKSLRLAGILPVPPSVGGAR